MYTWCPQRLKEQNGKNEEGEPTEEKRKRSVQKEKAGKWTNNTTIV